MSAVYRLLPWIDAKQAVAWLHELTGTTDAGDQLLELCEAGHCRVFFDCAGRSGFVLDENGVQREAIGTALCEVCQPTHLLRTVSPRTADGLRRLEVVGLARYQDADMLRDHDGAWFVTFREATLKCVLFKPSDIQALANKLLGGDRSEAGPAHAEQVPAERPAEQELDSRERATFERLVYVLAKEAGYQLDATHADETTIQQAAAAHNARVPTGKGTIAKYLKAAKARAEQDREL